MTAPVTVKDKVDRRAAIDAEVASTSRQETLPYRGKMEALPVVRLPIDLPVYRMGNGRTQVEQYQYVEEASVAADFFETGEENVSAQQAQHRILVKLSKDEKGPIYQELARVAQQRETLILTSEGVVVNGNRRLAAMRELNAEDPKTYAAFSHIDAVILPATATAEDLELLEAELQMTPETKLDYGWVERRLKLRRHAEQLKIPRKRIKETYRFKREEDINTELAQLSLAEEYLEHYLSKPRAYRFVAHSEQLFKNLEEALRGKSGEEAELRRALGFMLAKEAGNLGARVYNFNPIFARDFEKVATRFAEEEGIELADPTEPSETSDGDDDDDPLGGLSDAPSTKYAPLKPIFGDASKSEEVAPKIVDIYESIRDEKKEEDAKKVALKNVTRAHTLLAGVDLTEADPSTYSGIRAQLNAISGSATKLLEKLDELEKGGDPDGAAD
ncbi:MAG TPA: hypothetical protein DCX34_10415 [Roseovarius sp.]|nr:hypothetical protein [Roseovarius sp.]|tara:strand:- start:3516 stop:4850 length:1335 start_codon:yes stop_codon:yes gene_type:complete